MRTDLLVTSEFELWFEALSTRERLSVASAIAMLKHRGAALAPPYSRKLANSEKLIELRIQHRGEPYRVLYVFAPGGRVLLLLGGRKTGEDRWYDIHVPRAERLYAAYLKEPQKAAREFGGWNKSPRDGGGD